LVTSKFGSADVLQTFFIDRQSPIPLYFQVAQHLEAAIASGEIPPGTLFENEIDLAETMGVSRPTMRRAMEQLSDKGLIVRRRGIGTRVVQPKVRRPLELTSLFDDLSTSGQKPTTRVISFEREPASEEVAHHLGLVVGSEVVRIARLRSAGESPIALMTNYLPGPLVAFTGEDLQRRGLYQLMRQHGIQLFSATQTVGARSATPAEAKLLGEPRGAALLTMQRDTMDENGRIVEYGSHIYAASRYSFETHLTRP
jgi:GntR family transcriptional regulator